MTAPTNSNSKPLPNIQDINPHFPNKAPMQFIFYYPMMKQGIIKLRNDVVLNRKALQALQKGYPEKAKALENTVNRMIKQLGPEISEVLEPKLRERLMEVFAQEFKKYEMEYEERIKVLENRFKDLYTLNPKLKSSL